MLRLAFAYQLRHPLRSLFTLGSVALATFLLCILTSLVTTLDAAVEESATDRIIVQSAVSLFVSLPESYASKIEAVEGVEEVCWWNWFGGKYPGEEAPLNQFGVRMSTFLDVYDEVSIVEGSRQDFETQRTACIVGKDLAAKYGLTVGSRVPLRSELYVRPNDAAWEFDVAGIYESSGSNVDDMTMFFHYDYLDEVRSADGITGPSGVSIFNVRVAPGHDPVDVMARIDALYENGPQRTQSTSEAQFQAQFVSMVGNIPFFVGAIGSGVLLAVVLATLNTMLMVAREQTHDAGILKALGFTGGTLARLMLTQSLLLTVLGGGLGVGLALVIAPAFAQVLGTAFPGYGVSDGTLALAAASTVALGLLAGIVPALRTGNMLVVDALSTKA